MIRFTNATGYVATVKADPHHFIIEKCKNPASGSDESLELARLYFPLPLNVWRELELSIKGEAFTLGIDGSTFATVTHPFFDQERTTVLFGTQTGASIRELSIWDLPI